MTPNEQRIKIAEACGAKWFAAPLPEFMDGANCWPSRVLAFSEPNWKRYMMPIANKSWGDAIGHDIGRYSDDLNAMHEAEKMLSEHEHDLWAYTDHLSLITNSNKGEIAGRFEFVHASAAQRAEAFLRSLVLWKDATPNP